MHSMVMYSKVMQLDRKWYTSATSYKLFRWLCGFSSVAGSRKWLC
jgi:hypothetical protein